MTNKNLALACERRHLWSQKLKNFFIVVMIYMSQKTNSYIPFHMWWSPQNTFSAGIFYNCFDIFANKKNYFFFVYVMVPQNNYIWKFFLIVFVINTLPKNSFFFYIYDGNRDIFLILLILIMTRNFKKDISIRWTT